MTSCSVCTSTVDFSQSHFTGKERDAESGNDYFGARYYASSMGRWMSPDLPFADQHSGNPQSWNLYSYTRNNPLRNVDPNGRGVLEAFAAAAANWAANGITRDGSVRAFARNVGIGLAKGAGQLGVGIIAGAAVKAGVPLAAVGMNSTVQMAVQATTPSNQTQAQSAPVGTALAGAAITAGVGAVEGAMAGGAEATSTTLFRAVGSAEMGDLQATGTWNSSLDINGAQGKGFFYSQDSAVQFGAQQSATGGPSTSVVTSTAPTDMVNSSYQQTSATEGPAVFIENQNLPQVKPQVPPQQ